MCENKFHFLRAHQLCVFAGLASRPSLAVDADRPAPALLALRSDPPMAADRPAAALLALGPFLFVPADG